MIPLMPLFSKSSVFKMFFVHMKIERPAFSPSSGLKSIFEKGPFSRRISADSRPYCGNKAAFS